MTISLRRAGVMENGMTVVARRFRLDAELVQRLLCSGQRMRPCLA
jgi:hypothetical protein